MSASEHFLNDWMILLKFGKRQHLEEFRRDGLLYLNSQTYFANLEADLVRSDRFEGTDRIIQPKDLKCMTIESNIDGTKIVIPSDQLVGPVLLASGKRAPCNIYCMFAVTEPSIGPFVDERNFEFGDSFVLVLNTQEFLDRVSSAVRAAGFRHDYRRVEYYDAETHSGETGPFRKPLIFAYQSEFRFVIGPGSGEPVRLSAGSLVDITSDILSLSEINHLVDFGPESAERAGLS
jgi:hypothetical protein